MSDFDPSHLCGWSDEPQRHVIASQYPLLSQAAPYFFGDPLPQAVYLYKAWLDVLGKHPSYPAQQIGDCTSVAAGHAIDLLQCVEIKLGDPEEFKEVSTEAIYGLGREIAGMLGGGDGCYGSAVAKAVTQYGVVPREAVGPYSGQRAKQWGGRGGVPDDVKQKCKDHKLLQAALVKTTDELKAALANGYPVTVASNQGFTMTRDATGLCKPQGSWAHQMFFAGYRKDGAEFLICQSWGDNVPSGPTTDDQPTFSFWADARTVGRMLAVEDSWSFANFSGFKRRDLPAGWSYMGMF